VALLRKLVTRGDLLRRPERDHAGDLALHERAALTRLNNLAAAVARALAALA
jgi:hypothetical protein